MAPTSAQRLSHLLLTAFQASTDQDENTDKLQEDFKVLYGEVGKEDYVICLAWASEQHQLVLETKGKHVPSVMG